MNISVVIPSRNEENYIEECVMSFIYQNYKYGSFEILVLDGLSDDQTKPIVSKITSQYQQVRLIDNPHQTTPFALNKGIEESKYDYVLIFGAHAIAEKDFLNFNAEAMKSDENIACVGGIIKNSYANDAAKYIGNAMSSKFGVGNVIFRTGGDRQFVDTVAFGMYKKEVLNKIGYFDQSLARNQDDELNYRVISNGYKILYDPKIKSKYYVRGSVSKLYKQYFQYGYWKVFVGKKHKSITTVRQLVPFFFVVGLIVGLILSLVHYYFAALYIITLLLYMVIIVAESSRISNSFSSMVNTAVIFPVLHWSYGWGYLQGVIDFVILNKKMENNKSSLSR